MTEDEYPTWLPLEEREEWDLASTLKRQMWGDTFLAAYAEEINEALSGRRGAREAARNLLASFVREVEGGGRIHPALAKYVADRIQEVLKAEREKDKHRGDGVLNALRLGGAAYKQKERDREIARWFRFLELLGANVSPYPGLLKLLQRRNLFEQEKTLDDLRTYVAQLRRRRPDLFR